MKLTEVGQSQWSVESDSGNSYQVRLLTRLDENGSIYFKWACSCPSRKYPCKHALAIEREFPAVDEQAAERVE